jgi:acyl-CoA reductase-like NAD-dependent aldehyde dehydrogenase
VSARERVDAALARLREAGERLRAQPAARVHAALADVLDAWRAPGSPWQAELVERLPACSGFSAETVRRGLALGLAPYSGEALHALVRSELGGPEALDPLSASSWHGFASTAAVLAGAIPLPTVTAVIAPLVLRSPVLVKPSAHDPVTAPLLARALAERLPELGECVEVVDFRRDDEGALDALARADCVVATGSDAAVAAIGARVGAARRFVGHGHRFSLALIGGGGALGGAGLLRAARGVALDVALWDQLGCLSPIAAVVLGDLRDAERFAEALATALSALERRIPRGRIEPAAAAAIARERAEAEMRAAVGEAVSVRAGPGTTWTVVCEAGLALRPAPLHRFVRVQAVGAAELVEALRGAPLAGVAASAASGAPLLACGASRVCAPGRLQTPPLAWPRGGLGVLTSLARRASLESDR